MGTSRLRSRQGTFRSDWQRSLLLNGGTVGISSISDPYPVPTGRTMTDVTGPTYLMKPCTSEETLYSQTPSFRLAWGNTSHTPVYVGGGKTADSVYSYGLLFRVPTIQLGAYSNPTGDTVARSGVDVYSQLRPDAMIGATCFELLSFKSAYTGLFQSISSLPAITLAQVYNLNSSMRKLFFREAKRRNLPGAKKFLKEISNTYLGISFGALPLLRDVQTCFTVLRRARRYRLRPRREVYHGYATQTDVRLPKSGSVSTSATLGATWIGEYKVQVILANSLEIRWDTEHLTSFQQEAYYVSAKLGLYALFGTLWEIIPFSFISDWLLPTKQFVDRLDETQAYRPRFSIIQSCSSTKRVCSLSSRYTGYASSSQDIFRKDITEQLGTALYSKTKYDRVVPSTLPLSYWDSVPGINTKRASYLCALVLQRM